MSVCGFGYLSADEFNKRVAKLEVLFDKPAPCEAVSGKVIDSCIYDVLDWVINNIPEH